MNSFISSYMEIEDKHADEIETHDSDKEDVLPAWELDTTKILGKRFQPQWGSIKAY